MPVSMTPRQILRPVSNGWILLSFLIGFTLNFIPWGSHAITVQPDFILLLLLFWCTHQPRKIGMSFAFFFGLIMDIADANVFGQHALAYLLTSYLAVFISRRLLMQTLWQQSVHIFGLLLLGQFIMVMARLLGGANFIGLGYFVASLTGALLWPFLSELLQAPQRQAIKTRYESSNGP